MKYRLAVLLLLIIATLSQDTITQLGKEKPEIEETQQNNSTKSTQELLASIPNHNKPVLLLNPGKYANSSSLLGIENQIQRSTENYLSKNEPATYSLEINQQKRLQKNNKLAQQKQESKKGEKEALKKQKEVIVDEAEKKLAKVLEQQKSLKNLDDKEISKHKMAEKTKKLEQSLAQEKTTNKKSPKYSRANKIVKNAKSQAISNFSESKQAKKEKNQTLQAMKQTKNDIKIIPLSSQYGKNRPRSEGNLQKSSASSKKAENLSQKTDEKTKSLLKAAQTRLDSKLNKKQEISNQNMKQNAAELSIKQSQKLQKLIQQVKNTKQQLPQKSKKQIIQYLQTKKKQKASQDQQQSQVTQTIILNQQISQKKEESQYALVVDEVIEISQQTKQSSKQMNNSTISVIMILTIFISIPIVKEIRSRNDQDQQLKADKGNGMMASNEKLQKTSDQKYYDELNNQSGEEVGQRIYEEII